MKVKHFSAKSGSELASAISEFLANPNHSFIAISYAINYADGHAPLEGEQEGDELRQKLPRLAACERALLVYSTARWDSLPEIKEEIHIAA